MSFLPLGLFPLHGVLEGPANASLAALASVDGRLGGNFIGRVLLEKATDAAIEVFGILADDNEINVIRPATGKRCLHTGIQLDRTEIDVLIQLKP